MSIRFRCTLVLLMFGDYAYGDHVTDPLAMRIRCNTLRRERTILVTGEGDDTRVDHIRV